MRVAHKSIPLKNSTASIFCKKSKSNKNEDMETHNFDYIKWVENIGVDIFTKVGISSRQKITGPNGFELILKIKLLSG